MTIVKDINLTVEQGKPISLVGPSGSRKTNILDIMAGLDLPTFGTVNLFGSEITNLDEDRRAQIRGQDVGFVFQSFHLMPRLTALDNVMLPLEISGDPFSMEKAQEALEQVGLSKRAKHFATQLSGGEKQRVAIARSIVNKPKIDKASYWGKRLVALTYSKGNSLDNSFDFSNISCRSFEALIAGSLAF